MNLKVFVGENPNTHVKGVSSMGTNIFFGTVVPDHVGDNYAFIISCRITNGKLSLVFDKKPTNLDITKVTIGGIDTPVTWDDATNTLSGTADAKLVSMFDRVGGNTDSMGDAPVAATPPPNNTTFVSAEVLVSSGGNWVEVTLSDANGYASVHTEWSVKINGAETPATGATGHGTTKFHIGVGDNGTIKAGDTVTVSHLVADSGIVKFLDQPVTNSLV